MPYKKERRIQNEEEGLDSEIEVLARKMERFSCDSFKKDTSAEQYIDQFERICRVKGLGGSEKRVSEARKDLFLAYVGSEALQKLNNFFTPRSLDACSFLEVRNTFISLYSPSQTIFSARCEFERAIRNEEESFTDFYTRVKELSKYCKYGAALDERIRDKFVAGVRHEQFELEVRYRWPDGTEVGGSVVTAERVFSLARSMEIAKAEVASTSNVLAIQKKTARDRNPIQGKECYKCGLICSNFKTCPAKDQICRKCGLKGHFARVCKRKLQTKVDKVGELEQAESSGEELRTINKLNNLSRASINVKINSVSICMEFDSGARISTISESLWRKIGKPTLTPMSGVTGYGKHPLKCLGKARIKVSLQGWSKVLPAAVMAEEDVPLFGLPWIRAFKMPLPKEVTVKTIKNQKHDNLEMKKENIDTEVKQLIEEYKQIFSEGLGKINGVKAKIHLKRGCQPISFKARRVPFPLKKAVEKEIDRLVMLGVLEKVDPGETAIEWSTPTVNVNKGQGRVRICGDFRVTLNNAIIPDVHPMPTFAELTAKIEGGEQFTVIDLRDAYLQMEVEKDCQDYLIIATHRGFFKYTRLPFGITSAPATFQRYMEDLLEGIPNVGINLDDVIVSGKNKEMHLANLRAVLERMQTAGVRAKVEKCQFLKDSVIYLGHRIDKDGIHPSGDKVQALRDTRTPKNKKELRAFLGALNFYEKFIPHLHSICASLHSLTSSKIQWKWTQEAEKAFQRAKDLMIEEVTLVPYKDNLPVIIACDASEQGLGAVLFQKYPGGVEKPVAFASRTLQGAEKCYSSVDREALACVFGVVKFHQYIFGRRFTLVSDHKPLERIFGKNRDLPKMTNNRLVRWALFLNNYDFDIEYRLGKENVMADALSRLPSQTQNPTKAELSVKMLIQEKIDDISLTADDLKKETKRDKICDQVKTYVETSWPGKLPEGLSHLSPFFTRKDELSSTKGILMWGGRIVVPENFRKKVLKVIHEGHPGIAAMRSLARYYVWWPKLDEDIDKFVKNCVGCQENRPSEPEVPLYSWNVADEPWERLHLDYAGPFQGNYWLVGVDAYSKWPEISVMSSTTAASTINKLREWFSRYGLPKIIVTDNGSQFTARVFKDFCKHNRIRHICSSPYHPKTNGQVERFIRTFKSKFLASKNEMGEVNLKIAKLLLAYRNSPHKTTQKPPAELFIGRRLPTLLDRLKPTTKDVIEESLWKQKKYHDEYVRTREFSMGEEVWVQKEDRSGWVAGTVDSRSGELSYKVKVGGLLKRKHADQLRKRTGEEEELQKEEDLPEGGEV